MPEILDPRNPQFRQDPYPFYARMRREPRMTPVFWWLAGSEVYPVTRYSDVSRVLKEELFVNDKATVHPSSGLWMPKLLRALQDNMVRFDGTKHRRLRNLVQKAFTPNRVETLSARIRALVDRMLDRMEEGARRGPVDLISGLALPLPLTVISEMMGLDEGEQRSLDRWMAGLMDLDSGKILTLLGAVPRGALMMRFFTRLIEQRRRDRRDDMISALIAAEEEGDKLSADELLNMVFLLLLAGHETTVNLLGNSVIALLDHPEQLERLRAEPALIDSAVEELLRFTNPVQSPAPRYLTAETELGGNRLPRGAAVLPIIASANHDETVFLNPDALDLGRTPNKHLAFGHGVHYCVGAPLARLEAKHALSGLVERFSEIALATPRDQLKWRRSFSLRGVEELPLRLGRQQRRTGTG
jgi:cytochrome P450 PksS